MRGTILAGVQASHYLGYEWPAHEDVWLFELHLLNRQTTILLLLHIKRHALRLFFSYAYL